MVTKKAVRPVVVTTQHRGVFFGNLDSSENNTVVLSEAQMCVYWSADVCGVLGLAATGPSRGCRVTPVVPRIVLSGVTAVMDATEGAVVAWRARPWSR
jgi:hypothetical protein